MADMSAKAHHSFSPVASKVRGFLFPFTTPGSMASATGHGRAPGTCGELVQGQFKKGEDFLVTLPVDLWSGVSARLTSGPETTVWPAGRIKMQLAARRALDLLGCEELGARLQVATALPSGKGMASSTADIVAACRAVCAALGAALSPGQISHIAVSIEPSDGIMYPGIVAYNHRNGRLIEALGPAPGGDILVADLGGVVNTVAFNRRPKAYTPDELEALADAYTLVRAGVRQQDLNLLGEAASLSARVNQRLLPKPQLETLIAICKAHGGHGVCVAHSGTVAGLLFPAGDEEATAAAARALVARLAPPSLTKTTMLTTA